MATSAGVTTERPITTSHCPPERATVSSKRWNMDSPTAAQVRSHPRIIQAKYGNSGEDHGASRSRRITTPRFTAVSDTKANAIVIEIDGRVVLGLSGAGQEAQCGNSYDKAARQPPGHLRPVDYLGARVARRAFHYAGVRHIDDETDNNRNYHEELAEQQLQGEEGNPPVYVEDRRVQHQLQDGGQDGQLQFHVRRDTPVDVPA